MDSKLEKIISARTQLRNRFVARMESTPSLSDTDPMGTGAPNRHGMPKLPAGQTETQKWPVLDLGKHPDIPSELWQLELRGACANPCTLDYATLQELEQVEEDSDFHCVTTWSRMNLRFSGVRLLDIIALAQIAPEASHIMCHGYDGYSTNLSLEEALKSDVLLVTRALGKLLTREHGGPVRMITPQLYAWKGAKWISAIEFMVGDKPGFWEQNGYSMTGNPWREDRYSKG